MGKYTAFDLGILQINAQQINREKQNTAGAQANNNSSKEVVKHMEYREIAKHLTPQETCQQLEQSFTKNNSNQQHKTEAILQHYKKVFAGIGKHKYHQIALHIMGDVPPVVQVQQ